jgi:hypothetical protein
MNPQYTQNNVSLNSAFAVFSQFASHIENRSVRSLHIARHELRERWQASRPGTATPFNLLYNRA